MIGFDLNRCALVLLLRNDRGYEPASQRAASNYLEQEVSWKDKVSARLLQSEKPVRSNAVIPQAHANLPQDLELNVAFATYSEAVLCKQ